MRLRLTPSQENYLEHIWRLSGKGPVRSVDIAGSVGVKRPSVSRAVNTLMDMGLVKHRPYKGIELTQTGYRTAKFIVNRDRSLKQFLTRVLQMDPKRADDEVCRMEHAVSAEVIQRLDVLLKYIDTHSMLKNELNREMKRFKRSEEKNAAVNIVAKPHV